MCCVSLRGVPRSAEALAGRESSISWPRYVKLLMPLSKLSCLVSSYHFILNKLEHFSIKFQVYKVYNYLKGLACLGTRGNMAKLKVLRTVMTVF